MYISELKLKNFRGFKDSESILFNQGTNVIIGPNNAGKTSILKALELLFGNDTKRLTINDFNKHLTIEELKETPPKISITAKIVESENDDDYSDDLVTVSTWLTKLDKPYEACITYEFFLPQKNEEEYLNSIKNINGDVNDCWDEIEYSFLRKYTYKIYVGYPEHKNIVDPDSINKFDFQFLTAIRDVERDLFTGRSSLLKEVISFFMDYEIKTDSSISEEDRKIAIDDKKRAFSEDATSLIKSLQDRMKAGKKEMLKYVEETGASFDNSEPSFEGRIFDTELYSALKLMIENEGFKLPATQNGLGYNNLIYISLLLAKMQINASGDYLGSNAKTYSILAIEEPEAHLHPNMQYKFLKFLDENQENKVNQIFVTSHSPNITAAVDLENIIILYKSDGDTNISYPGRVFTDSEEDILSKNYVQRFLDVTKADMFFARNLILVEGISEQLLVPEFAKIMNQDLTDSHVSVINMGGRYFEHFLKLFDTSKSEYAIKKKVACITDLDPVKKETGDSNWTKCLPFALGTNEDYEYKECSNNIVDCYSKDDDLIRVYSQEEGKGCTFEYELILKNPDRKELVTDSVRNNAEIKRMMTSFENGEDIVSILGIMRTGQFKENISNDIAECGFDEIEKIKHIIAARYLKSVQKGAVAQELAYVVSETCQNVPSEENFDFNIPKYIMGAIEWICQEQ
ncbi:MAG: ATP-dependent endonuclease [Methanobacterium formicicum]|uniref:ATP-dependent nuclease n=1 Tax=Methanobacterium formicicum TaxID=2162 RepID=UPI0035316BB1